jgi:predicted HTH domain antitoxin
MNNPLVTKSVRLTSDEANALTNVAKQKTMTESALMKKWIIEGIQTENLERAIQAYMKRETDLRGGVALAGISYNRFMEEVQDRNIVILDDDQFLERLYETAEMFQSRDLMEAIRELEAGQAR